MQRQPAAILLTGGRISQSFKLDTPVKYKALLQINGRPMVDYVLRALQESEVERVFIIQEDDEGLDGIVTRSNKNIFLSSEQEHTTLISNLFFGLEKAVEYYGLDELNRRDILVVPCDIPLVKKENLNRLIEAHKHNRNNSDISVPIIDKRHLEHAYPQRRFRGVYFKDLNGTYVWQSPVFLNCARITLKDCEKYKTKTLAISGSHENALLDLGKTIDRLRSHREKVYQWPHTIYEVVRGLAKNRHLLYALRLTYGLCRRELTTQQINNAFYIATGLRFNQFESKEVEVSADIDRPDHLEWLLRTEALPIPEQEPGVRSNLSVTS